MNQTISRGHLKLAYSSSESLGPYNVPVLVSHDDDWDQLDLFNQPDTVFFASPEMYAVNTLFDLLKSAHVTQIIDLRQIPHFSFGGNSRARFLEALADLRISYSGLPATLDEAGVFGEQGRDLIQKHLQSGPLMVFSDLEPDRDPDIAIVIEELDKARVKFVKVFTSI